jgi:hypothetical protein
MVSQILKTRGIRPLLAAVLSLSAVGAGVAIVGSGGSTQPTKADLAQFGHYRHGGNARGNGRGHHSPNSPGASDPTTTTRPVTTTTDPVTTTTKPVTTTTKPVTTTTKPVTTTTKPVTTTTKPVTTTTKPVTTTTAAPAAGGTCTNPSYSTGDAEGTDNVDPNDGAFWWVNNDAWSGSHGPQTIAVCNQSSWNAVSTQPNDGGQVQTYPDTEYDVGGRDTPSTTPISGFQSITSTFAESFPSGVGGWDAAYDLWLNNWSTEIMIWNEWSGAQSYWPDQATTSLTLDGVPYKFYNNGGELMFFRGTQVKSGSVDILAAFQWLVSQGIVRSTDVPTQLEYGVEVCYTSGAESFPLTGLTFSVTK